MSDCMIDRVNNQKYYEYAKVNQQKRESTEASEFNLNMGKEGVIYEKGQQKKAAKPKETAMEPEGQESGTAASAGVKVEISSKGYEKSARERQRASLAEQVQKIAAIAVDFLKSVWDKIWNDHPKTEEMQFPEILEDKMSGEDGIPEETGLAVSNAISSPQGEAGQTEGWPAGIQTGLQIPFTPRKKYASYSAGATRRKLNPSFPTMGKSALQGTRSC